MASELNNDDASTWLRVPAQESPAARAFVVHVETGDEAGRLLALDVSGRALIGTSPACDLRLTDRQVSRRHLALEIAGEHLRVVDLNSRNGTTVGALRVVEALLQGGERVGIGATTLRIERRDAADVKAPSLPPVLSFGDVVGASEAMRRLHPLCQRLAASDITVLIEGETGTGKEALARALHENGPRANGPFVVFDCTAVPTSLVESELFGHERGAFTGAVAARHGVFAEAQGGTLLIDEIGDLEPALQPKLLRAVERNEVRPVGSSRTVRVDVRLLVATRRDLDKEVETGRFRDDLFHRLAVARIELPPLRKRVGDVRLLAAHFCTELGGEANALPESLLQLWDSWSWPGNVRELRNAIARHLALGDLEEGWVPQASREPDDDGEFIERVLAQRLPLAEARQRVVEAFERRYLERVLQEHGGNVTRAAEASGIARRHFYRLRTRGTK